MLAAAVGHGEEGGRNSETYLYTMPGLPLRYPPCRIRHRRSSWLDLGKTVVSLQGGDRIEEGLIRLRLALMGIVRFCRTARFGGQLCSGRRRQSGTANPGMTVVQRCRVMG